MKRIVVKKFLPIILLGIWLTGLSGCGGSQVKVFIISPRTVTIPRDQPFQFTLEVTNTQDTAVTWSIDNDNGSLGSMDPYNQGIYTPPAVIPTPNTLTVRVTSVADPNATDAASVTLVSGNTLRFGTNTQVTGYKSGTATASTLSSGQHSIQIYQTSLDNRTKTTVFMVWSDNSSGNYDIYFQQITLDPNNPITAKQSIIGTMQKVNDDNTSTDQIDPALAVDSSGNVYIAWADGRNGTNNNIFVRKGTKSTTTDAGGNTTIAITFSGSSARVNTDTITAQQGNPAIATDGINALVTWQDNRNTNGLNDIYFAKAGFTCGASKLDFCSVASVQVNATDGITASQQINPTLAFSSIGIYVAWTDGRNGNNDIFFAKSADGGITWSTNVKVNDDTGAANHTNPSLAVDTSSNVYVAWQDNRNGNNDIFFAKSTDVGATFVAITDQTNPNNPTEHNIRVTDDTVLADHQTPSITVEDPESNAKTTTPDKIYVSWQDNRNHPCQSPCSPGSSIFDIFTAKSTDGGNTFQKNSAPANLPPENNPTNKYNSSIAVDTFGRAYLIWTDKRNDTVMSGIASDVFFVIGQ